MSTRREAWIAEAKRRAHETWKLGQVSAIGGTFSDHVAHHLCDLIETNWQPTPEVDAVTLAGREWMKRGAPYAARDIDKGLYDGDHGSVAAFRAGHAHALADHPDTKRMDWLEGRTVSGALFMRSCGEAKSLRAKIDKAMEGGE